MKSCEIQRTKRGGPGGQHRNKVESAFVITHLQSGIRGEASERRSQHENKSIALGRLRKNLAIHLHSDLEWSDFGEPSELWKSRCNGNRINVGKDHEDMPLVLAEVFERLHAIEFDLKKVAEALQCSSSQLVKFLKKEPAAFAKLNQERIKRNKSTYK